MLQGTIHVRAST